jgi:hypothetical protein
VHGSHKILARAWGRSRELDGFGGGQVAPVAEVQVDEQVALAALRRERKLGLDVELERRGGSGGGGGGRGGLGGR